MKSGIIACALGVFALGLSAEAANATSGPGCLRVVNVASNDVLNVRERPSASSRVVDRLAPGRHGIIHLDAECTPKNRPWGQRWCPITHYDGNYTASGYVKARYIRDQECP
jgi:hypothetical protein